MKPVRIILSSEAEEAYKYLNAQAPNSKIERSILNSINKKKSKVFRIFCGITNNARKTTGQ